MHKVMTGVTDDVPQWGPPVNGGSMWWPKSTSRPWVTSRNGARR